ncbi:hypothetical protein U1Q18_000823, partial [Sarracenia purpurea var. burkii]
FAVTEQEESKLVAFLKANKEVFASTLYEISGIALEIISHRLNVDPSRKPNMQKMRRSAAPYATM